MKKAIMNKRKFVCPGKEGLANLILKLERNYAAINFLEIMKTIRKPREYLVDWKECKNHINIQTQKY
jgi:hypothetical protein